MTAYDNVGDGGCKALNLYCRQYYLKQQLILIYYENDFFNEKGLNDEW